MKLDEVDHSTRCILPIPIEHSKYVVGKICIRNAGSIAQNPWKSVCGGDFTVIIQVELNQLAVVGRCVCKRNRCIVVD